MNLISGNVIDIGTIGLCRNWSFKIKYPMKKKILNCAIWVGFIYKSFCSSVGIIYYWKDFVKRINKILLNYWQLIQDKYNNNWFALGILSKPQVIFYILGICLVKTDK